MFMQIKFIFTRKVLHIASFNTGDILEVGNGLFLLYLPRNSLFRYHHHHHHHHHHHYHHHHHLKLY